MKAVWFTDCDPTVKALTRPVLAKITNKRSGLEFAALRQSLWRMPGQDCGDPHDDDVRPNPKEATDKVRWIDTDVMVMDQLTKRMEPDKLWETLNANWWDIKQPIESLAKKRLKQQQRKSRKPELEDTVEVAIVGDDATGED